MVAVGREVPLRSVSAAEAVAQVRSGDRVFVHEAAMAPTPLLTALAEAGPALHGVEVLHLHLEGPAPHVAPGLEAHLRHNAWFVGSNTRAAVEEGRADFTPIFLSAIPSLLREQPVDVALVQVSPPDRHGYCRLGLSAAVARAAVDTARVVVAEMNARVPRTHGNTAVHVDRLAYVVETDRPLPTREPEPFGPVERAIGLLAGELVPDGATLQMGIGAVPDAILAALGGKQDLGIHTEMFTDGLLGLLRSGAVSNRFKSRFPGRVVSSFAVGSASLHDYVHENPSVEFHPSDVVNDVREIEKQHVMVAINSALAIDLTGQVCADSLGTKVFSGIGGQMDFVQGARRCPGGRAIIALPSTAAGGRVSRIVPHLREGSGVVTTRGHVQWVVTEHGRVDLSGLSLRQRAERLIGLAHPDHRAELRAAAVQRRLFPVSVTPD